MGFPGGSEVKSLLANTGDVGSIPGSGWSLGKGNGNPLQYSCLGNPMDRGAWQTTVHGAAESWTRLMQLSTHAQLLTILLPPFIIFMFLKNIFNYYKKYYFKKYYTNVKFLLLVIPYATEDINIKKSFATEKLCINFANFYNPQIISK